MRYLLLILLLSVCTLGSVNINQDQPEVIITKPAIISLQDNYVELARKIAPSVVEVRTYRQDTEVIFNSDITKYLEPQATHEMIGLGSGFMIEPLGYILTNHHVVDNGQRWFVKLACGLEIEAKLIGIDKDIDIAILEIPKKHCKALKIGNNLESKVGDLVFAFGSPLGLQHTVTAGIISSFRNANLTGEIIDYIQSDVAINGGNSGGPMVNAKGEVIGINNWLYSNNGSNVGLGFALPSNLAMIGVKAIIDRDRGLAWIGVLTSIQANGEGILILGVLPHSPAEKAGLKAGDRLTMLNGNYVKTRIYLKLMLAHAFHEYELTFKKNNETKSNVITKEPEIPTVIYNVLTVEHEALIFRNVDEISKIFYEITSDQKCACHQNTGLLHCTDCSVAKSDISFILKALIAGHSKEYIELYMLAPIKLTVWLDFNSKISIEQYKTAHFIKTKMGNLVRIHIRQAPIDFQFTENFYKQADIFESLRSIGYEEEFLDNIAMGLTFDQTVEKMIKIHSLVNIVIKESIAKESLKDKKFFNQLQNDFKESVEIFYNISQPFIQVNNAGTALNEKELIEYIYNYLLQLSL